MEQGWDLERREALTASIGDLGPGIGSPESRRGARDRSISDRSACCITLHHTAHRVLQHETRGSSSPPFPLGPRAADLLEEMRLRYCSSLVGHDEVYRPRVPTVTRAAAGCPVSGRRCRWARYGRRRRPFPAPAAEFCVCCARPASAATSCSRCWTALAIHQRCSPTPGRPWRGVADEWTAHAELDAVEGSEAS